MALTLLGAITDAFQASSLAASQPQSPWLDEPKEGLDPAVTPYTVISRLREREEPLDVEDEKKIVSTWTMTVYGAGEAATEAQAALVRAVYDDTGQEPLTSFTISRRNLIRSTLTDYVVDLDPTRSPTTRRITAVAMQFYAEWEYA